MTLSRWEWAGEDCCDSDCWECLQHPSPSHHMLDYNLSLTEIAFVTSFWNGDLFYLWAAKKYTTALNYIPQPPAEEKRRKVSICGWQGVLCETLHHSRGSVPARWLPWQLVAGSVLLRLCLLRAWVRADEPQMYCPHTHPGIGETTAGRRHIIVLRKPKKQQLIN